MFDPTFGKRQPGFFLFSFFRFLFLFLFLFLFSFFPSGCLLMYNLELLKDYDIPPYFPVDYFGLLEGLPDKKRKVWRWLVFGPGSFIFIHLSFFYYSFVTHSKTGRSMTKFHVDPCMTSAWNALLCGKKRWAFYPPSPAPPPGSFSKYDHDEVSYYRRTFFDWVIDCSFHYCYYYFYYFQKTWDHTIKEPMQWYCEVYPYLQPDMKPLEVVQNPGDLLYVPSGI